eukprot:Nitzschia sp. Nitz4//scaffold37_size175936//115540//116595//NITZ4_002055-RA/size175936-processed-gene-0.196-mRNA-1//1//CDS//3329549815//7186//frame0
MIPKDRLVKLTQAYFASAQPNEKHDKHTVESLDIRVSQVCRLWAGMGHIYRVSIPQRNAEFALKHVTPPPQSRQSFGDRRKAWSYQVEANFYQKVVPSLIQEGLSLPIPHHVEYGPGKEEITICMSYLHGRSIHTGNPTHMRESLKWLAKFHAAYWGDEDMDTLVEQAGLQETGSYWHLDTRPDEHDNMSRRGWEGRLKLAAKAIDTCLKRDPMQCLIHGDPKEANIMALKADGSVAMYDFQYCGKGSPTRDLAYFLCSSCDVNEERQWVQFYYDELSKNLLEKGETPPDFAHLCDSLELAFCDFCRFMCGWGHWGYDLQGRAKILLNRLDGGKSLGTEEAYMDAIQQKFW